MILITGSSGLIGTNLALYLLDQGHEVLGVDLRSNPWTDRIPTIIHDLAGRLDGTGERLTDHLERTGLDPARIAGVVHLAAIARVYDSVCEPEKSLRNLRMVHTMLEFCRPLSLPILFSSSREVYGNIQGTPERVKESGVTPSRAASPYAAGKIAAEAYISAYGGCFNLPTLICRLSNVYGRYDSDIERMDRVIPLFIQKISSGEPITIFGPEKVLDFTYIDDCVSGIAGGLEGLLQWDGSGLLPPTAGMQINIATGRGHTLTELAQMIAEELGCRPEISIEASRPGEVRRYIADISVAKSLLGYRPKTDLAAGIRKSIAWWRESEGLPRPVPRSVATL